MDLLDVHTNKDVQTSILHFYKCPLIPVRSMEVMFRVSLKDGTYAVIGKMLGESPMRLQNQILL